MLFLNKLVVGFTKNPREGASNGIEETCSGKSHEKGGYPQSKDTGDGRVNLDIRYSPDAPLQPFMQVSLWGRKVVILEESSLNLVLDAKAEAETSGKLEKGKRSPGHILLCISGSNPSHHTSVRGWTGPPIPAFQGPPPWAWMHTGMNFLIWTLLHFLTPSHLPAPAHFRLAKHLTYIWYDITPVKDYRETWTLL